MPLQKKLHDEALLESNAADDEGVSSPADRGNTDDDAQLEAAGSLPRADLGSHVLRIDKSISDTLWWLSDF